MLLLFTVILLLFCLVSLFSYLGWFVLALGLAILLVIVLALTVILEIREVYRVLSGNAPYLPSGKQLLDKIIQEVDFKDGSIVYELGCGDGRFLRRLSKLKKIKGVGYEYFLPPYLAAKIKCLFYPQIKIRYQNFFKVDLSKADHIFCYLFTEEMAKLEIKLQNELKPGALVISNSFKFKNWQPEKVLVVDEQKKHKLSNNIYIYRK